jgi:pyrroline-5-carboxylate reductase
MTMSADVALSGTLVLLGAGKMGGAMLQGWLDRGVPPGRIVVLDPSPPDEIAQTIAAHGIRHNPAVDQLEGVEVLVLAIKPQNFDDVLPGLGGLKPHRPLVVSIAAGRTIAGIAHYFGEGAAVIRAMPNVPAAIGRGITTMVANPNVSTGQLTLAQGLLEAVGEVVTVDDEGLMDAVTAVAGSGPAYVFQLAECMAEAGVAAGLPPELATKLARATVSGAGELMRVSGRPAAELREMVTSPKGTTYEALAVLMAEDGLKPLLTRAVAAAARRSRELAR